MTKKIEKQTIEKVLDAAHIEEVVQACLGTYGPNNKSGLKKAGVRYKALCPFHADRSLGSFIVYPKGNCYKCFSCGEAGGVVDFLMKHENLSYPDAIRWLGKKYNIEVDDAVVDWTYTPKPAPPPLDMLELPMAMVERTTTDLDKDPLAQWIRTGIKWDYVQRKRVDEVLRDYHLGHGKNGHTIFWNIGRDGKVRTGKMMKYYPQGHPKFGHRDKEAPWNFDWIHSSLERGVPLRDEYGRIMRDDEGEVMYDSSVYRHIYDPDKQEPHITFFGMHLLNAYPEATIKLVESEKTAMLMAIAYGNHKMQLWIACGGLEMMTRERLTPLIDQGRRIILYPDRDGIDKWKVKAEQMHYDRLTVDTQPVTEWWIEKDGEKADIADVVVRMINTSNELSNTKEIIDHMPQTKPLIEKLNLEPI